jgi:hypothetical protein
MVKSTESVLKMAKKRRGLTVRDINYWLLEDLVKRNLMDRTYPRKGRGAGWPFYKISRRGRQVIAKKKK